MLFDRAAVLQVAVCGEEALPDAARLPLRRGADAAGDERAAGRRARVARQGGRAHV